MNIRKLRFITLAIAITGCVNANAQSRADKFALIPYPKSLTPGTGSFQITDKTTIVASGAFANEAKMVNVLLSPSLGSQLAVTTKAAKGAIVIKRDERLTNPEAYTLTISPQQVVITAKEGAGVFHAVETIRQLLPVDVERAMHYNSLSLPAVTISDAPAYQWRGMHLDVARHFFSVSYLKKFIDILALYKMNKLHLHLTDDQGWRIEIKKYPKLTEEGAWRTFNNQDSVCMQRAVENPDMEIDPSHIVKHNGKTLYGGFYTQQQMKDVVAYAAARHIDIIPEIDMPGHMMAAINSYPFLTCNGENTWGKLFTKPICPCNETTFEFAQNVFKEIMAIFPSKYIHIGGDEVDRTDWGKSEACKQLMEREGIKDLPGLQSYFINRMEKFFNANGRQLIGWDEVLEGGVTPTAMIMYWRVWVPDAPVKAAKNGNHVVMAPGNPLYFDSKYDKNSAKNIYFFNPIPKGLTAEEAKLIEGAQAEIWTEYVPSEKRADYQYMPRMTALSELLWTNDQSKYDSYKHRIINQFARLDALDVNYRLPDLDDMIDTKVFVNADTLKVKSPLPGMVVRYTNNGTMPTASSPVLNNYIIYRSQVVKLAAFTASGRRGDIYTINYKQQPYAAPVKAEDAKPGIVVNYYPGDFKGTTYLPAAASEQKFVAPGIVVLEEVKAPSFGLRFKGYIDVPQQGIYTFYLTCDDAGVLKINGQTTVDNDGMHSPVEKSGQAALDKGLHPFELNFVEGGGGYTLKLQYSLNGSAPKDIPASWFKN
ncbi:family 20 glycosylhydrolase [Mucilaginibacter sp. RS28]|uniref:beta-N-acetylhexosaminidase n=1 Tax=Mucilaginibacter straminoryzae TaxID=2932774 RepID=A0A9X1X594_9SPHI|nr:family 20 glycosylhydrolase [Mucilaginibacter straminoryzae]MCJ8209833.1 family 20 glycosylhydrolase [Mucilaginibacter straminoryzae]